MTDLKLVEGYRKAGRVIVPVPAGMKRAAVKGWQDPAIKSFEIREGENVAWRLDDHLDIDIDSKVAAAMAKYLLPATGAKCGRPSAGVPTHWVYNAPPGAFYAKFSHPLPGMGCILEIRTGPSHYTLIPPSVLPPNSRGDGEEATVWWDAGEPGSEDPTRRARLLAAATAMADALGLHGLGHDTRLEVAGLLLRHGVTEVEATVMLVAMSGPCYNTEVDDCAIVVRTTAGALSSKAKGVSGGPKLAARIGEHGKRVVAFVVKMIEGDKPKAGTEGGATIEGIPPLTETGDAEKFAELNADSTRFDFRRGRWLIWGGHAWRQQSDGQIDRAALIAIRARQEEALALANDDARRACLKWAIAGEARARRNNLAELAKSIKPIADDGENWDRDPWLLGVPNGVIDLRTGELRDGHPLDRITMQTRTEYNPHAECPLWEEIILEIFGGDPELVAYLWRYVGYTLTGDCREECLVVAHGSGRNGKGTLMNTLAYILGDHADNVPFSTFELGARGGIPNDIAKIDGKRMVTASETSETVRLNEARIKSMTGRDPITARYLHKEWFTFNPVCKIWLATNHKPEVRDDSAGFWSRIHMLPFEESFEGRENKGLKDKLIEEAEGILAWAVRGCLEWQRRGLDPPAKVKAASQEWRDESDILAPFFEERCVIAEGARCKTADLFQAYERWAKDRGHQRDMLTHRAFGMRVKKSFKAEEGRTTTYIGVGLRDDRRTDEGEM